MKINIFIVSFLFLVSCNSFKQVSSDCSFDKITRKCVYIFVEEMPIYNNGESDFVNDIIRRITLPDEAKSEVVTRINLQFVIDEKGNLIGARIKDKDELNSFERELLDIINSTGKRWNPGVHYGKKVPVLLTYPLNIDLMDSQHGE